MIENKTRTKAKRAVSEAKAETAEAKRDVVRSKNDSKTGGLMQDKLIPFLVALVVIGAFAVGLLYGKVSVYEKGGSPSNNAAAQPGTGGDLPAAPPEVLTLTDEMWDEVVTDPVAAKGDADASVVMVEFTDYQCPFCKRYFDETYGQIMENYVDAGEVYYVVRDLPLSFHANAKPAAIAARCAGNQNKYFEMHDALYENQTAWANASDPTEQFVSYAGDLGLNAANFSSCLEDTEVAAAVDAEVALANKVGATGTPTFFINGEKLVGAQPYSAFEAAIEAAQ